MPQKKIMIIIGTRPEAVKLCPVIKEFEKHPSAFEVITVLTGQHREMLDQVMSVFEIPAQHDLHIMQKNQTILDVTQRAMTGIFNLLSKEKPDLVIAQGDTTTVFTAALMSFYQKIPFAHVEAGLRTYDNFSPYPEEINRRLTAPLAALHFAPTSRSRDNLLQEQIPARTIHITGNTVIDALLYILNKKENPEEGLMQKHQLEHKKFILVTAHRRESFGQPFRHLCSGLKMIADAYPDYKVVYPVHLNPNVRTPVYEILADTPNLVLIEPLDYFIFVHLMKHAYIILTDSGGIQEEAPSLGIPVLVLRECTERPEAVDAGTVRLVGTDARTIFDEVARLMDNPQHYDSMARAINPYGDGQASQRIVTAVADYFGISS